MSTPLGICTGELPACSGPAQALSPMEQAQGVGLIREAPSEKSQEPLKFMPWIFPNYLLALTLPALRPLPGVLCGCLSAQGGHYGVRSHDL